MICQFDAGSLGFIACDDKKVDAELEHATDPFWEWDALHSLHTLPQNQSDLPSSLVKRLTQTSVERRQSYGLTQSHQSGGAAYYSKSTTCRVSVEHSVKLPIE